MLQLRIGDHLAVDHDLAGRRHVEQVEAAQEGAFAGSGRTDDDDLLPFIDVRVDVAQHLERHRNS